MKLEIKATDLIGIETRVFVFFFEKAKRIGCSLLCEFEQSFENLRTIEWEEDFACGAGLGFKT